MAALTGERDTPNKGSSYDVFSYLMKGNVKAYSGGLANTDANGYLVAASDTANHHCIGRLQSSQDTTVAGPSGLLADGVASAEVALGVFEVDNPAGANSLTQADVAKLAYVLTDHEVARAAGTVNSVIAGVVMSVDTVAAKAVIDTRRKSV